MKTETASFKNDTKIEYPVTLDELLKANIPPVQYVIKPILPDKGKLLISASEGSCKTFFILNLSCAIGSGMSHYLGMDIIKKPVLCIMGEGGESELKRRYEYMSTLQGIDKDNISVAYVHSADLFSEEGRNGMLDMLECCRSGVLILDPISQFWTGDENKKEDVSKLMKIFDEFISFFDISIILVHHWRKPSQTSSSGGQMASGSYGWTANADGHVTLQGDAGNLVLSFAKVRSGIKPREQLILRLREEDLWLELVGTKGNKVYFAKLDEIFDSLGSSRVKLSELAKKVKDMGFCSRNTLEKVICQDHKYVIDRTNKRCLWVIKQPYS